MKAKLAVFRGDRPTAESSAQIFVDKVSELGDRNNAIAILYSDLIFLCNNGNLRILDSRTNSFIEDLAEEFYVRDYHGYERERYAIARYLATKNCRVYNSDATSSEALSKLEQIVIFCGAGLPVPDTVYGSLKHLERLKMETAPPYIVKNILGSNGQQNLLVRSADDLAEAIPKAGGKALIQQCINADGDFRVCIMYGKEVITYRRFQDGSITHLSNVAQGAKREIIHDKGIALLAEQAANAMKREFCAVDIIQDKNSGKLYLLECNFNGGMYLLGDGVDDKYFDAAKNAIENQ